MDPQTAGTGAAPLSPDDEAKVRATLERVLASPIFRKSEQCCKFLRYVVEHHGDALKERQIGADVFGRAASYDTAEDPIVRVRATEVRKRLAQYYGDSEAAGDVRFEIPAGAYHVEFHWPAVPLAAKTRLGAGWRVAIVAVALATGVVGWWIRRGAGPLDRFWAPAMASSQPVLIYCGQPVVYFLSREIHDKYRPPGQQRGTYVLTLDPEAILHGRDIVPVTGQFVGIGNAHTAAMLAVLLGKRGKAVEIRYADDLSFGDLRSAPSVLVGAFSNLYTLEMQDRLRLVFEQENGTRRIRDRSAGRTWALANLAPNGQTPDDYAIVSRLYESGTGQLLITAAGITQYGTRAAGEFLTTPELVTAAVAPTREDWTRKNLQVLLHTAVYRGSPGRPEIVAVHIW